MECKSFSVSDIADTLNGTASGDLGRLISGVSGIEDASEKHITFVASKKYLGFIESTGAGCIVLDRGMEVDEDKTVIYVDNAYAALPKLLSMFYDTKPNYAKTVSEQAFVGNNVEFGSSVTVFPFAYIGNDCKVGSNTVVYPGVFIGDGASIGKNTTIYSNVSICHGVIIGDGVTVHSGAVIGGDGFGYVQEAEQSVKIPQVGNVILEDSVEVGANASIDRATIGSTVIGRGTKIDNLVQIAHNVELGEGCIIISQVGISGSTTLGKRVFLGGQVGVVGHITIGDYSQVAAKSGISKSIPAKSVWGGEVGQPIMKWKRSQAATKRIPDIQRDLKDLKEKIKELEARL